MKPFEGASGDVGDDAYGGFWFAAYRMSGDDVKYFMEHHPDPKIREKAKEVWEAKHAPPRP